ncbi:MAG: hypothetical protein WCF26_20105 [Candidatus Sulfotelmatobacter sp.]
MLYLSIALVLIFVMYLLDKRNAWKGAAKIAAALVGIAVIGVAGIYGWGKYEDWKAGKNREADVNACMKSIREGSIVSVRSGDEVTNVVRAFCESNPGANIACGIKTGADGNLTTYEIGDTDKGSPGKVCTAKGWGKDPMYESQEDLAKAYKAQQSVPPQASTCKNWESKHPRGSPIDFVSVETNGKAAEYAIETPEGCSGPLEDAYNAKVTKYQKGQK